MTFSSGTFGGTSALGSTSGLSSAGKGKASLTSSCCSLGNSRGSSTGLSTAFFLPRLLTTFSSSSCFCSGSLTSLETLSGSGKASSVGFSSTFEASIFSAAFLRPLFFGTFSGIGVSAVGSDSTGSFSVTSFSTTSGISVLRPRLGLGVSGSGKCSISTSCLADLRLRLDEDNEGSSSFELAALLEIVEVGSLVGEVSLSTS